MGMTFSKKNSKSSFSKSKSKSKSNSFQFAPPLTTPYYNPVVTLDQLNRPAPNPEEVKDTRNTQDAYCQALKEEQFGTFEYFPAHTSVFYHGHMQATQVSPHWISEMQALSLSLPLSLSSSIFLRMDENRMDMFKVLISGPKGTPYAFGLFEFDIFIPSNYPLVPPCVQLKTTGAGSVRFNPNLYNCGKVCLSLLGTWSGGPEEMWQPNQSTVLQLLVSIQSLIMVEEPYYNEPGFSKCDAYKPDSDNYSQNIVLQNIRHAMKGNLQNPPVGFADVVRKHFLALREGGELSRQVEAWDKQFADQSGFSRNLKALVSEFEEELLKQK